MVQQQRQQLRPLRSNTRARVATVPGSPFAFPNAFSGNPTAVNQGTGGNISILLPQVGLLSAVLIWVDARVQDAAAAPSIAAVPFAPYNLLKRIQLVTNLGTASIMDLSGYGAHIITRASTRQNDMVTTVPADGGSIAVTNDPIFQYPTTLAQNVQKRVAWGLYLPVAANNGRNFGMGLINLQAPELRVNLNITVSSTAFAAAASSPDLYATTDSTALETGSGIYVSYLFYEIPPPSRQVAMPPLIVHRLLEDRTIFSNIGDVNIGPASVIPRQGKLLRMFHTFSNSAGQTLLDGSGPVGPSGGGNNSDAGVDRYRLVYNYTDTVYDFNPPMPNRIFNRTRFGNAELPGGTHCLELWAGDQEPARGDFRDVIDTEAISTIQAIATMNSALTITNGYVDTIREIVQGFSVAATGG